MTTNSFIPREKLTSYQRWKMDSLETSDLIQKKHSTKGQSDAQVNKQITLPTDAEIAAIFQNARKDGYAAGFQEGTEKGYTEGKKVAEAEIKNEATHLQTLLSHLNQDLQRLDQEVADELLSLAIALSKKMIGRALIIKPEFILPIVQDAIKNLPCVLQQPRLYLHPDDAKIIRSHMENQLAQDNWSIREDEQLLPGGCRIEVNGSEIDASLEVRWQKILSALGQNADWLEKND